MLDNVHEDLIRFCCWQLRKIAQQYSIKRTLKVPRQRFIYIFADNNTKNALLLQTMLQQLFYTVNTQQYRENTLLRFQGNTRHIVAQYSYVQRLSDWWTLGPWIWKHCGRPDEPMGRVPKMVRGKISLERSIHCCSKF